MSSFGVSVKNGINGGKSIEKISEYKFNKLLTTEKMDKSTWRILFDAKPAGFVCRQDKKYVAVGLRNNVLGDSKRFKIAKDMSV